MRRILLIAIVGAVGWFAYQEVDLGDPDVPAGPSVGYPVVDGGDGVHQVGEGTRGVLGP